MAKFNRTPFACWENCVKHMLGDEASEKSEGWVLIECSNLMIDGDRPHRMRKKLIRHFRAK
jgi:hypothetical protein